MGKTVGRALVVALAIFSGSTMAYKLNFAISGHNYQVAIEDSKYSLELKEVLPLSLVFEDYGSNERISYLDKKLNIPNHVSCTPERGDLTYFVPWGNIAVFKQSFRSSHGLYKFGKLPEELLSAIEQSKDQEVVISLIE